jgi:hypothetical protein
MRAAVLALISVCALAACNPSAPSGENAAPSVSDVFPNLTSASYRAEANITREGQTIPVVMIRDGQKLRMEINAPQGQTTMLTNGETDEAFIIATAAGQTRAMRIQSQDAEDPAADWQGEMGAATRTGDCSVAGENGAEWTREENGAPQTACVTSDGIILRATEGGQTVWETTSVQRGPQSADLFTVPAGVQVIDLNNLGSAIENLARSQGGQ